MHDVEKIKDRYVSSFVAKSIVDFLILSVLLKGDICHVCYETYIRPLQKLFLNRCFHHDLKGMISFLKACQESVY